MSEELGALQRRISALDRKIAVLSIGYAILAASVGLLAVKSFATPTAHQQTTVRRLAIVDENGTERVVIAAPLPDPIIQGKREKRDAPVSGILIFDRKGNERGGYVTSDAQDSAAFLSLDSEKGQVFTAYANADSGATVWLANEKHDAIAFSTHQEPVLEMIQNKKVIYKNPPTAPELH
jgi:hypothetical protein